MRVRYLIGAAVAALAVLPPVFHLSRPKTAPVQSGSAPAGDFSTVLGRLEREARIAAGGRSIIRLGAIVEEVDGRRTMSATRVLPTGETNYALCFRRLADRWVCCGATAEETESGGGKSEHRLGGDAIEIDQLVIWLGWANTRALNPSLPIHEARERND